MVEDRRRELEDIFWSLLAIFRLQGKVEMEMEMLTEEEANEKPAGK